MRIAPDAGAVLGDRQVEARRRQRDVLGASLDERKVDAELALTAARRLKLRGSHVDADGTGAAPGQPSGDVRGATAEFDDVEATDFTEGAQRCLRDTEDSPGDFGRRPAVACLLVRVVGVGLRPAFPVALCVVGEVGHHVPRQPPSRRRRFRMICSRGASRCRLSSNDFGFGSNALFLQRPSARTAEDLTVPTGPSSAACLMERNRLPPRWAAAMDCPSSAPGPTTT